MNLTQESEEQEIKEILKKNGFSYEERKRYLGKIHKEARLRR